MFDKSRTEKRNKIKTRTVGENRHAKEHPQQMTMQRLGNAIDQTADSKPERLIGSKYKFNE